MQTKGRIFDIVITGAGPAGATLAALLGRAGFAVALIDAEPPGAIDPEKPSGRTAALLNGSINLLKTAGIWDRLAPVATPLKVMRIIDDSLGGGDPLPVEFHADELGAEQFGFNVPNNLLRAALLHELQNIPAVTHLRARRLADFSADAQGISAHTDDGRELHARLIIGTDGRGSVVRKIAGIEADQRDYKQIAMTCLIEHSKPHENTSTEFHRDGGPFTFVPMPGNRSSVVWVEKTADANRFLALKKTEYEQAIQDRSRGLLGTIKLISAPESWPLMTLNARQIVGRRAALAAEAAHVLSPIGAQGLNLSLRDVATLAETLTDAARIGEDIGSPLVLSRYADRRRADIASHVGGIDHYNRAIANHLPMIKDMRRAAWRGVNRIDPLKRFLMRQGLAPEMDQGRLLAGAAL